MAKGSTWKSQEERSFQTKLRKTVPHVSENQEITAGAAAAPPDLSLPGLGKEADAAAADSSCVWAALTRPQHAASGAVKQDRRRHGEAS